MAFLVLACEQRPRPPQPSAARASAHAVCACELRSWVVARTGRHLYVAIDCPPGLDHLDTVVEFTSAAIRRDFVGPFDPENPPRLARMTRGVRLRPAFGDASGDRLELSFTLTAEDAARFQRDRVFATPYVLLGANSNAAMRAALGEVGVILPAHVLAGAGATGSFPGVDFDAGPELPADAWAAHGLAGEAEPALKGR